MGVDDELAGKGIVSSHTGPRSCRADNISVIPGNSECDQSRWMPFSGPLEADDAGGSGYSAKTLSERKRGAIRK